MSEVGYWKGDCLPWLYFDLIVVDLKKTAFDQSDLINNRFAGGIGELDFLFNCLMQSTNKVDRLLRDVVRKRLEQMRQMEQESQRSRLSELLDRELVSNSEVNRDLLDLLEVVLEVVWVVPGNLDLLA